MASIPVELDHDSRGAGKPPITAHPAFPAIVALWFAALFGLGSLILPVHLIESAVSATGIASLVPAAAPPLGFTARAAIALAATIFGGMLGFTAARRLAAPPKRKPRDRKGKKASHRFLNAPEDIGDEGIEAEFPSPAADFGAKLAAPHGRRRALTMEVEEGLSEFLPSVPQSDAVEGEDEDTENLPADVETEDDTLELDEETMMAPDLDADIESTPEPEPVQPPESLATESAAEEEAPTFHRPEEPEQPEPDMEAQEPHDALAFSPPSLARQPDPSPKEDILGSRETNSQPSQPESPTSASHGIDEQSENDVSENQIFHAETAAPAEHDAPQEDSPGLVQLVQKLGDTLERHREWSAQRAAERSSHASEAAAIPQEFEAAPADDAAEAMAAYFGKPSSAPVAPPAPVEGTHSGAKDEKPTAVEEDAEERPSLSSGAGLTYAPFGKGLGASAVFDDEEDGEDDEIAELAASFKLPLMTQKEPAKAPASLDIPSAKSEATASKEVEGETAPAEASNPFKRQAHEFVRIEEPEPETAEPAVLFPNQEAHRTAPAMQEAVPHRPEPARDSRAFDPPAEKAPTPAAPQAASNDDNERALREALINLQRMSK